MKLYFGSVVTSVTTLLLIGMFGYIGYSFIHRNEITLWGRRIAVLLAVGLVICIFAASRDNYHMSVQNAIDGSTEVGVFSIHSIQSTANCIIALGIVICGILSIFMKSQDARQVLFFILSLCICMKIGIIEFSRIWLYLQ